MANEAIKTEAKMKGVSLWKLADKLGIADATLSRKLRHEFTEEEKQKAMQYINEIYNERRF